MENLDPIVSVAIGLGLAAACGFRVFVPLLAVGIASRSGTLTLAPGFEWVASDPALLAFATATLVEVAAYHVPFLDHLLDTLATPSAVVAGVVASAAVLSDLPPLVKWSIALIDGGGAAGLVQGATALSRLGSTALTGGLANPLFATFELIGAVLTVLLAITFPVLCLLAVGTVCLLFYRSSRRALARRRSPA